MLTRDALTDRNADLKAENARLRLRLDRITDAWPEHGPGGVHRCKAGWQAYPRPGVVRTFDTKLEAILCLAEEAVP